MNTGLLHLHNLLRWVVLITLLLSIVKLISGQNALKTSKILLISAHSTLVLGLYQYFFGAVGFKLISAAAGGMKEVMKDATARLAVEHISSMLIAIVLITIGHISLKKGGKPSLTATFYLIALLLILSAIPWPFRAGIGRPWLPGL